MVRQGTNVLPKEINIMINLEQCNTKVSMSAYRRATTLLNNIKKGNYDEVPKILVPLFLVVNNISGVIAYGLSKSFKDGYHIAAIGVYCHTDYNSDQLAKFLNRLNFLTKEKDMSVNIKLNYSLSDLPEIQWIEWSTEDESLLETVAQLAISLLEPPEEPKSDDDDNNENPNQHIDLVNKRPYGVHGRLKIRDVGDYQARVMYRNPFLKVMNLFRSIGI